MPRFRTTMRTMMMPLTVALLLGLSAVQAAEPALKTQVPGWYRMMLGDFEVTTLYDGYLDLETNLMKNATPEEVKRGMARAFLPAGGKIQTSVNAFLINTGTQLVLIDTGTGKNFGPTLGSVVANLKASGYEPAKVDRVLVTHLHGDHQGGLLTDEGRAAFPNAVISPSQLESDYWLDKAIMEKMPKDAQGTFMLAQKTAAVYMPTGQWKPFALNSQIVPGITSVATGHTPGHSSYLIESKGHKMIVLGDVIHFGAVQFARPDVVVQFDTDNAKAAASRKALFAAAAKDGTLLAGAHLTFPGLGHIRPLGKGYEWVPVGYSPVRTDQ
jgi:glyoxylase-like metal-dependent hydrolase (beta-lactamase superfamily II)